MQRTPDRKDDVRVHFPDLKAFYEADPERTASEEHLLGTWWRSPGHRDPAYQLMWLDRTQELLLIKCGMGGIARREHCSFTLEHMLCPAGSVQVVGWCPRAEPPLPIDTYAQRLVGPLTTDDLAWLQGQLERHEMTRPL